MPYVEPALSIPELASLVGKSAQWLYGLIDDRQLTDRIGRPHRPKGEGLGSDVSYRPQDPPKVTMRGKQRVILASDAKAWLEAQVVTFEYIAANRAKAYRDALREVAMRVSIARAKSRLYQPSWEAHP
jgi:predicted DNA-binding transcriptional regulator AlpA